MDALLAVDPTTMTIGGAVATALVGAIKILWGRLEAHNRANIKAKEDCEKRYAKATKDLLSVQQEVGEVKLIALGHDQARKDLMSGSWVKSLSKSTLEELANIDVDDESAMEKLKSAQDEAE